MEKIRIALLTGQRYVVVNNIEIQLPTLPRETQKIKEGIAEKKAKELYNLITT